jgi:hypothetical protein
MMTLVPDLFQTRCLLEIEFNKGPECCSASSASVACNVLSRWPRIWPSSEWPEAYWDACLLDALLDRLTYYYRVVEFSGDNYRFQ